MADWTWEPAIGDDIARKGGLLAAALSAATVACLVAAFVGDNLRYVAVMGLMLATLVWLGRSSTRQLRTLEASVDGGVATFTDSRRTTRVDLRTVESVNVSSRGDYHGQMRWAIEAIGPDQAVEHRIANVEQYWALGSDQIDELRRGLQHYHQWYRSHAAPAPVAAAAPAGQAPTAQAPAGGGGSLEWRIPRHPNADRNQKRVLVVTVVLAAALAAAGIVASWPDPLGVILSIVVLPGLVSLLGGGLWWAYTPVRRFRLTADQGVLSVHTGSGSKPPRQIALAGANRVVVDTTTSSVATGTGSHTRHTMTYILVEHPDADDERIVLPSGPGSAMRSEERLLLESQLRRLAGC